MTEEKKLSIALIAHDKKKKDFVKLAVSYEEILKKHTLYSTGTTGQRIMEATDLAIHRFKSGPLGGDQQIGAYVSDNKIDMVIFLRDPLTAQPHEPDISALLRLCDVYEIPLATNLGSAELLLRGLDAGFLNWRAVAKETERKSIDI
ncbi:methylglyoxal synthase [Pisciglobus halotolerans]|uniref:Methylglyoxal synthase n=1 Tax=Pisciglobus halotolerans TaxID=745365 RepID=A0A1I3D766_9LACT|nr:methylglyoxal synthase [Pisciglobus halotolerans]SFH82555.1 methylglyoxal synthase [Pisciglobus halotolerans]